MSAVLFTPYSQEHLFLPPFWRHSRHPYGRRFRHGPCGPARKTFLSETDNEVQLVLEVPGVKTTDLNITIDNDTLKVHATRKIPGQQHKSFQKEYSIDESSVDTNNIKANLSDGVLVITIPKTKSSEAQQTSKTRTIEVVKQEPSDEDDGSEALKMPIDVPGIKVEDLKVEYGSDILQIIAKRKVAGRETTLVRQYAIDRKEFESDNITATLSEGVLLVTIPKRARKAPRSVTVTTESYTESSTEEAEPAESPTEETGSKEEKSEPEIAVEAEAVVETVEEDDEEKDSSKKETDDWEEVA